LSIEYDSWLAKVCVSLNSINMPMESWQGIWTFDFHSEFEAGTSPRDAAMKANRFWWQQQNRAIGQDCQQTSDCWLPRGHEGNCERASTPATHREKS
jgi:hypothetical protein